MYSWFYRHFGDDDDDDYMLVLRLHSLGRTTFATLIAIIIDCSLNDLKRNRTMYALDSSGEFYAHAYAMRLCNGRVIEMKTSEKQLKTESRPTQTHSLTLVPNGKYKKKNGYVI